MIKLSSPAKINLFLNILSKDENRKMHKLETAMLKLNLCDYVTLIKNDNITEPQIFLTGKFGQHIATQKHNNIFLKTIHLFHEKFQTPKNFEIYLEKNIPIGAGLGGGSSNAGILIKWLNEYFRINLSIQELKEVATKIGADVMFFVFNSKLAFCDNFGENVTPMDCVSGLNLPILLISSGNISLTKNVFSRYASQSHVDEKTKNFKVTTKIYNISDIQEMCLTFQNNLLMSAMQEDKNIADVIRFLRKQKEVIYANISGTGSTSFAIANSVKDLQIVYHKAKLKFPHYFIHQTNIFKEDY